MHQKTRYNLRLAEKKGVTVREARNDEFEVLWELMRNTCERDGFRLHGKEYYREMLKSDLGVVISDSDNSNHQSLIIKLFFAEYEGKVIAANIIAFFGDTVTYVHGASADKYRNVMAPYLLQWHCIKTAKEQGYKYYDFYGIDENKWPGVTRFKKGFGGEELQYPGTFDAVFGEGWYNMYKALRWVRRKV